MIFRQFLEKTDDFFCALVIITILLQFAHPSYKVKLDYFKSCCPTVHYLIWRKNEASDQIQMHAAWFFFFRFFIQETKGTA